MPNYKDVETTIRRVVEEKVPLMQTYIVEDNNIQDDKEIQIIEFDLERVRKIEVEEAPNG